MPDGRHTLLYSKQHFQPEDLLNFWELEWFYDSWESFELTDEDLAALQISIMCAPRAAPVISGTRGLRKLRYSPESWNTGKSHALRVCYVYFEKYGMVLLCLVFRKGELETISAAGKKEINKAIVRIEENLKKKFGV
jgi:hypothetical protein